MTELTANKLPQGQSCGTCRFAGTHVEAGAGKDRTRVRCLRFPPQRLGQVPRYSPNGPVSQAQEDTGWPVTTWDDWCGEWKVRNLPIDLEKEALVERLRP